MGDALSSAGRKGLALLVLLAVGYLLLEVVIGAVLGLLWIVAAVAVVAAVIWALRVL